MSGLGNLLSISNMNQTGIAPMKLDFSDSAGYQDMIPPQVPDFIQVDKSGGRRCFTVFGAKDVLPSNRTKEVTVI